MNSNKKPETENFKFMCNRECEYFPCHEVDDPDEFNCLFCYCPLYTLGHECGGNFVYTEKGIKDCSNCMIPHSRGAYDHIMDKSELLIEMARKK
ncbi:MAG: cysteine-rich small domain-containing protein [Bacillota bacterium]|nr:cysteine-rich small domain-containing protein [Bacillota bacterium]